METYGCFFYLPQPGQKNSLGIIELPHNILACRFLWIGGLFLRGLNLFQ